MSIQEEVRLAQAEYSTRRHFLKACSMGLGAAALNSLTGLNAFAATPAGSANQTGLPHFAPKAKRVIYLHMAGSPSQLELFDYKPELERLHMQLCPTVLVGRKTFCFYQWDSQNAGTSGQIFPTWPVRCLDIRKSAEVFNHGR